MDNVGSSASGFHPAGAELHGRYRIIRIIGRGGMSAVYEAEHSSLGKRVAIKEMMAPPGDSPEAREIINRFQNEARTLARLEHRYFPDVTDFFSEDSRYYLVMEYVDGETLEDYVKRTPGFVPEDQVLRWASQICDVLSYLHSQSPPVVFRDLKPSNIMVDETGKVKLIDFGIARFFKPGKQSDTQSMGTAGYSAPEQYGTGQTDARSDIYSLGACLHFLLTRRDPTASPFNFPPVREINPKVSSGTERVVAKCLSMKAEDRYASAADVKKALIPAGSDPKPAAAPLVGPLEAETTYLSRPRPAVPPGFYSPAASMAPQPVMLPPAKKSYWGPVIALIIAILAVSGIGAYLVMSAPKAPAQVVVPGVVGDDRNTAAQALTQQHLTLSERGYEPSTAAVGTVTRQDPPAQALAEAGQAVGVWLSKGPDLAVVPDVTNVPEDRARSDIAAAGLKVGQVTTDYSTVPKGYVIHSIPPAHLKMAPGQPVGLVVSLGTKPAPPPPLAPPVQPVTPPEQPNFSVRVPVPADGQPHEVRVMAQQTDGTQKLVSDKTQVGDAHLTIQAPDGDSITAAVDGQPVSLSGNIQQISSGGAAVTTSGSGGGASGGEPGSEPGAGAVSGPGGGTTGGNATVTTSAGDNNQ